MKKVKLSTSNIVDIIGASNVSLIKGLTLKSIVVPDTAGYILILALNQATGGHSGIIAFGRALGHIGNSFAFHVGNYITSTKTKWSNPAALFYSVKKNGIEYIAVRKDAAVMLVQLLTFYGAGNQVFEYAAESALTEIVQMP